MFLPHAFVVSYGKIEVSERTTEAIMSDEYVIVEGNFMDGFKIIGPFHDIEAAQMWGEYCVENEWWFTTLHTPEYDRNEISQGGYYWSDEAKAFMRGKAN